MSAAEALAAPVSRALPDRAEIEAFLIHEAELLDSWTLQRWLDLYTEDAIYWVPTDPRQTSGLETVSHIFDDRLLLETRVRRTAHALFHAQKPPSSTVHLVTNLRFPDEQPADGAVAVLTNQQVVEYRNSRIRHLAGKVRHELVRGGPAGWRIRLKRFDLVNADGVHEGISIII